MNYAERIAAGEDPEVAAFVSYLESQMCRGIGLAMLETRVPYDAEMPDWWKRAAASALTKAIDAASICARPARMDRLRSMPTKPKKNVARKTKTPKKAAPKIAKKKTAKKKVVAKTE